MVWGRFLGETEGGKYIYIFFLLSHCCIFFSTFLSCRCSQAVFVCLLEDAICHLSFLLPKYAFEAVRVMHLTVQIQQCQRLLAGERAPFSKQNTHKNKQGIWSLTRVVFQRLWLSILIKNRKIKKCYLVNCWMEKAGSWRTWPVKPCLLHLG